MREKKKREYKKIVIYFCFFLLFIFALSVLLYFVRIYVIEQFFVRNNKILSPQGSVIVSNDEIRRIVEGQGVAATDINISTESGEVVFILNGKTRVLMSSRKEIKEQLDLVEAIDRQIMTDGKQAISIDLRYNKPIVKF